MPCEEGCRTAVLGKTERTVGWEGNGKLTMIGLVRHCKRGNPQKWIGPIYRGVSHSFTLDIVFGFQYRSEAQGFLEGLRKRLGEFNLELHDDKTRLIEFGRFAAENRRRKGRGKPETLDFLGFTHICGQNRDGKFIVLRHTIRKRQRAKLNEIKRELRRRLHIPIPEVGRWLRTVLRGHYNYYGVPNNGRAMNAFRFYVTRLWFRSLCRRSQRTRINWARMGRLAKRWLPYPKIQHPYPGQRLHVFTQGRSPVR
jgi:RNA-directed DNA polymerase